MLNIDIKTFEVDNIRLNAKAKTNNESESNDEMNVNRREFVVENCDRKQSDHKATDLKKNIIRIT